MHLDTRYKGGQPWRSVKQEMLGITKHYCRHYRCSNLISRLRLACSQVLIDNNQSSHPFLSIVRLKVVAVYAFKVVLREKSSQVTLSVNSLTGLKSDSSRIRLRTCLTVVGTPLVHSLPSRINVVINIQSRSLANFNIHGSNFIHQCN